MKSLAGRFAPLAFTGVWLWIGALAPPAAASEAASAIAPPAARLGEALACRLLSPQFEAKGDQRPVTEAARFVGGATLRSLVGAPCPRRARPVDL